MGKISKRERLFSRQAFRQNIDVYILIAFGILFSVPGFFGAVSPEILGSATLALLASLAISQIRSRFQVEDVASTWHRARTEILDTDFPDAYKAAQRSVSKNYFYTGETMMRTISHMRTHFPRIFANGGSVKILLPNPNNNELMKDIAKTRKDRDAQALKYDIVNSFRVAKDFCVENNNIELRTMDVMPRLGINGLDMGEPSGKIMVQMYEYQSSAPERGPIFLLETADGEWFKRFSKQIDRLWDDGEEYVPATNLE